MRGELLRDGGERGLVPDWRERWLARARQHADNPFDQMLHFDNHTALPNDLLVKMDIASMHCSLEARSPLLDHELAEFCAALPLNLKLRNRSGKYLLKQLAAKTFGRDFVNRPKQGFGIPLEKWMKGPLREHLTGVLRDTVLMEPFDSGVVARTAGEFFSDRPVTNHVYRLWAIFMYGLWRKSATAPAAIEHTHGGIAANES